MLKNNKKLFNLRSIMKFLGTIHRSRASKYFGFKFEQMVFVFVTSRRGISTQENKPLSMVKISHFYPKMQFEIVRGLNK